MRVLSLFDGMSCGRIAFERAGIKVDEYHASEIDKHAIKVSRTNWPEIKHLGSVTDVKGGNYDIVIGGSPCQGFSFAGKGLNFSDPRSALFFEFVRIYEECKAINPNVLFLLENVRMKKEHEDVISRILGIQPININSSLVSAQNRERLYWTNIPSVTTPNDKCIGWHDLYKGEWYAGAMRGRRVNNKGKREDYNKNIPLVQYAESRKDNKTNCLTTICKDNIATKIKVRRTPLHEIEWRYFTRNEMEWLQNVPENYTVPVSYGQAVKMLGNGWTVDVIAHILKHIPCARQNRY